jgi:predicted PurR-regulated permease PerM
MTIDSRERGLDLHRTAAVISLGIGMIAAAALLYQLVDVLLVLFLGIIVATALQPLHTKLCDLGVPRGPAVLLIYLSFLVGLMSVGLLVAPVLLERVAAFTSNFPDLYADAIGALNASPNPMLRLIGRRLPSFDALVGVATDTLPSTSQGVVGFTSGVLMALAYVVTVLAVGYYWTMEVSWLERFAVSFVPVARRVEALNIWHEIELKLGAFIRGQGVVMISIGVASAIGYAMIGLPNVLALAVLAGLLEALPLLGPILAAIPAIVVALPLGSTSVCLVISWALLLQVVESNVLAPRIMGRTVGMSSLVALLAILACGTLYGLVGVFVAIPLVATITVVLDRAVINLEPVPVDEPRTSNTLDGLRTRLESVQQQMRRRFRERPSRVGIDPETPDHIADAIDLQLEKATERVKTMISATEASPSRGDASAEAAIVCTLAAAIARIEQAVEQVETALATADAESERRGGAVALPTTQLSGTTQDVQDAVDSLHIALESTQQATAASAEIALAPAPGRCSACGNSIPAEMQKLPAHMKRNSFFSRG